MGEAENLFDNVNAACGAGGCGSAVVNNINSDSFGAIAGTTSSRQVQREGHIR